MIRRLTTRLRQLMTSKDVTILMEAHNGLSAKLVQEAGFEAIWASGLAISAALGVRDSNEASWTQVLEVLEFMSDASDLPILLDGDTGYGNFNNARRLVRKLEQRNIAGVCLEDKLFPKTNSFIDGEKQMLAAIDEFCGKIRAAKDTQRDSDFVVVARTEAFISGWGLEEALLRASAYTESGADIILVHSKRNDCQEVIDFMDHWDGSVPIVIVPTKYPSEPLQKFVAKGIHNFIFANHSLRTVITALQKNLSMLRETKDLMAIEESIAPVKEIFRLQNVQELKQSEKRYLPEPESLTRSLVLAASKGDFGELVTDRPKCMLYLKGKPILSWHIEAFRRQSIKEVGVVRGYCKDSVDLAGIKYYDNDLYKDTGELYSLYTARDFLKGDILIAYGDIVFDDIILQNLIAHPGKIKIAVDASWRVRKRADQRRDLVETAGEYNPINGSYCYLTRAGSRIVNLEKASGEWIGLLFLEEGKTALITKILDEIADNEPDLLRNGELSDLLNRLVEAGENVTVAFSYGHWQDLDEERDLLLAEQVTHC